MVLFIRDLLRDKGALSKPTTENTEKMLK